jgi:hypothetical protein
VLCCVIDRLMPTEPLSAYRLPAVTVSQPETQSLGEVVNAAGDTKIELLLRSGGEGEPTLELVEYSWGSGLGWYPRKRLTLDTEQGAGLAALLGAPLSAALQPEPKRHRPAMEQEGNVIRLLFAGRSTCPSGAAPSSPPRS